MKPDFILTSDWHLTLKTPIARTDNYTRALWRKLRFISRLQEQHGLIPILCGGDVFDVHNTPIELLTETMHYLPHRIYGVPGQHDLPRHRTDLINKSGLGLLNKARKFHLHLQEEPVVIFNHKTPGENIVEAVFYNWNSELPIPEFKHKNSRRVAVLHKLVYKDGKPPFPGAENIGIQASDLIKKLSMFDLILTGDNHETIWEGQVINNRVVQLVNPGSLTRTKADQTRHKPSVFLWNTEHNDIKQVFLPIREGVLSRQHIDEKKERDDKLDAFIESIDSDLDITLNFSDNLKMYMAEHKVPKNIRDIINEVTF